MFTVKWKGGVEGSLFIKSEEIVEFRDPWKLVTFIEKKKSDFTDDELLVIGGLTLFMSIREQRASKGPNVLRSAKKGIDSFGMIASDLNEGIENLASKLQPVRSEDGYTLMISAYNHVVQDLETLGWLEAAA